MEQIIECVPNFSEGRNKKTIQAILASIKQFANVKVLDFSSDYDHNRTVITFLGTPQAVVNAAFAATKTAAELIDLNKQSGVHPRIGATDVIPLIPLKNISFEETVKLSAKLAGKISRALKIPTYLYENSAREESKKSLAEIRKNSTKIKPDFGPKKVGPAGATVIGARNILIAFNINLKSKDPEKDLFIAKKIARKIREKDGGFPKLRALGLFLPKENKAQISMNFLNYKITGLKEVYEKIASEVKKFKAEVAESELIGLLPRDALNGTSAKALKIKNFNSKKILDNHY